VRKTNENTHFINLKNSGFVKYTIPGKFGSMYLTQIGLWAKEKTWLAQSRDKLNRDSYQNTFFNWFKTEKLPIVYNIHPY